MKVWLQAVRPKTLIASISPVLIGTTLALSDGSFDPLLFLLTLFTALCIQIGTNLANDYFDFLKGGDTHLRKGPVRVTQAGLIAPAKVKMAALMAFSLAALFGSYLVWEGGLQIAFLLGLSILLGYGYTAGPFPLAYLGLGDLFVFIFFGPVAVAGTYFLQTHLYAHEIALAGIGPGLIATSILVVPNLRDVEEDRHTNKRTLIVRFGTTFGKWEYTLCVVIACLFPLLFTDLHPLIFLVALTLIPGAFLIRRVWAGVAAEDFLVLLPKAAGLQFLYTLLFCIGWIL